MHTFGEKNGVKFRVNHDRPLSMESIALIEKMVSLASKIKSNEHREKTSPDHQNQTVKRLK
jgi:hypothetical protein